MAEFSMRGVSKTFGALVAIQDLSFDVERGELHGLIGPNGAGKTTAVNIATGFYRPSSGSVWLRDKDVTEESAHHRARSGLARTFQGSRLFGELDVFTNLQIAVEQRRRANDELGSSTVIRSEVEEALDTARLSDIAYTFAKNLSYGQKKQLEIARACALARCVLFLDEPTAGLSDDEIERSLQLVLRHRSRLAILVIEHNMDVIMSLCDRITVIDAGRMLMTGTPVEVQNDPRVISAYLGGM